MALTWGVGNADLMRPAQSSQGPGDPAGVPDHGGRWIDAQDGHPRRARSRLRHSRMDRPHRGLQDSGLNLKGLWHRLLHPPLQIAQLGRRHLRYRQHMRRLFIARVGLKELSQVVP